VFITEQGDTKPFPIKKEVCQGCVLSQMLFNPYAESVMRDATLDKGIRIGVITINNFLYADDVTLAA